MIKNLLVALEMGLRILLHLFYMLTSTVLASFLVESVIIIVIPCHELQNMLRKATEGYSSSIWAASSEFGTYRLCEQRRFRRACASAQSRQNLRCSLIQVVSQEEPSDRKPNPWPLWMAGHAQLKFVMTECAKTQIRLTRPILFFTFKKIYAITVWLLC